MRKVFILIIAMTLFGCQKENSATLTRKWKLIKYHSLTTSIGEAEPANIPRSIIIEFSDNGRMGKMNGHTVTNSVSDVIVVNNKAYIFYFTHPDRKTHFDAHMNKDGIYPFNERRSSIEVGPLDVKNGTLVSDRNKPFDFWLTAPL